MGETQFRQVLNVDREGFVFIPEVGQVFVNGLNLSLLESKLFPFWSVREKLPPNELFSKLLPFYSILRREQQ